MAEISINMQNGQMKSHFNLLKKRKRELEDGINPRILSLSLVLRKTQFIKRITLPPIYILKN